MEMVFMVRLARCLISLGILFPSCADSNRAKPANVYVEASNTALLHSGGELIWMGKKFNGYLYALYQNGDTASIVPYVDGKEHGWSRAWYQNKRLASNRFYNHGRKEGKHISWWENGNKRFEYNFRDDDLQGAALEWFENGKPFHFANYTKGHEDGRQQLWWDDGRIRANYFVKDGEQFGLIGRKICTTEKNDNSL